MEYKKLGRTKLKVSVIGFGGGALQDFDLQKGVELILNAKKLGLNIIDADKVNRKTEKKIGFALENSKKNMIISTKSFAKTKEDMDKAIIQSLKDLHRDCIDIYKLHMIENKKDLDKRLKGSLISLKKARSDGKIKFIGFSGHHIPTLIEAIKTNEFDTALIPYNLGHTLADELLDTAKEHSVGVMIMKALGGGFLIDPKPKFYGEIPKKGAENMNAENALRFILADKRVDTIIVGLHNSTEIKEVVAIGSKHVNLSSEEKLAMKNRLLNFLGEDYCRNCKYCMPCKTHLDIPEILKLEGYYSKYGYKINSKFRYSNLKIKANACTQCGECEKKCPYNLPIRNMLKQAHKDLND